MASGQAKGAQLIIYCEYANGDRKKLFSGVNEQTGPGGSPDGSQATVKDNELPYMAMIPDGCPAGSKIILATELKVADGIDASDCVINLPVRDQTGAQRFLVTSDLGIDTDLPASSPVGLKLDLGEGYTVPEGQTLFVGGNKYFMSIENDTA